MAGPQLHLAIQIATTSTVPSRPQLRRWVRGALASLGDALDEATFTLRFVGAREGRALNRAYRGRDYATNVLTFPLAGPDTRRAVADIVVCMPVVVKEARAQHKTAHDHCAHLVVHGVLHATGHDHETAREAAAMEASERLVLARFRIADPYAVHAPARPSQR
jgi:probable rRNA maturation factor